jgi:DNA (cytosine-5)-methyltransferase 1
MAHAGARLQGLYTISNKIMTKSPTVIDFFCGVGGLSLGFAAAGYNILGGNDLDQFALDAFVLNHPHAVAWRGAVEQLSPGRVLRDTGLRVGELDVLVGGPPCQGFSRNRARRHVEGKFIDDPRNYLFKEFLRFVKGLQPRTIVIENVADMLVKADGRFAHEISNNLRSLGYATTAAVLNAADFGVPQRRKRAIILGSREGILPLPSPTHSESPNLGSPFPLSPCLTIWDAIGDLASLAEGDMLSPRPYESEPFTAYQKERRGDCQFVTEHVSYRMSSVQRERLRYLSEGDGAEKLPKRLAPKSGYGSAYRRMARDITALTVTTWMYHPGSGMFYHPTDARMITLREAARLQSFDDSVQFAGGKVAKCRQVGNAVPPLLARAIGETIRPFLQRIPRGSPEH